MMTEPLEVKFLGNDLVQIDGCRMTIEMIKAALNPNELSEKILFNVKRIDNTLQFTTYYDIEGAQRFFEESGNKTV